MPTPPPPNEASPDDGARAALALLRPALMAARAGVWDYDPEDDRMRYCLGAARVLGLPSAERRTGVPLERVAELVHPDDRGAYRARIAALGTQGGGVSAVFRTAAASGGNRSILLQGQFEDGEDGRRLYGRGVVIDVSADFDRVAGQDGDEGETAPAFAALMASIDLVIAARRAMLGMDAKARTEALTMVDALLSVLGRQLAASLAADRPDRDPA